ncbi:DUF3667 domain-containing protein [Rasiella rasia]|uniref:DUF3667 domain-containing protein n=1 Tax=Rasiella rasia TaxID=2744027 RepID=A0A6G6GPW4_9FLAO|nr:DUF3667 domain-containing protein [Rasiella rasia]QIE60514.1 DUF3667 domain-containing protein [Rasiella rasia]
MECKNCKQLLKENDKFCSACGAKVITQRLTFSTLLFEVREHVLNLENNRPLHTFIDLFIRPKKVVDGFVNGVRKRYINPFGYMTVAVTLFGLFLFFFIEDYGAAMSTISTSMNGAEIQNELSHKINNITLKYQSLLFFLFIPFLALISKLVFLKNKKYNYFEHLIINTYGQAHISISATIIYFATIWFESVFGTIAGLITFVNIIYFAYLFKTLYSLSFWQIFLKTLLFIVILIPFIIAAGIGMWVVLLLSGQISLQELMEMQKAQQGISYIASSIINWTS